MASERSSKRLQISASASIDASCPASPQHSPTHQPCKTTVLLIVMHAGSVLGKYINNSFDLSSFNRYSFIKTKMF